MEQELLLFWMAKAFGGFKTPKKRTNKFRYIQFFSRFVFLCSSGLLDGFWNCFFGPLIWQDLPTGWKWILSILELHGNNIPRNRSLRFLWKTFRETPLSHWRLLFFCCENSWIFECKPMANGCKVTLMYHKYPIQLSAPWRQQVAIDH